MSPCVQSKKKRISSVDDLLEHGLIDRDQIKVLRDVSAQYDIGVTEHIRTLLSGREDDPIARQYIPSAEENIIRPDEEADPIGDNSYSPVKGIVHRYPDRVLLKATPVCAVYCRYCFRREMVGTGSDEHLTDQDLDAAINYITEHKEVWEVILTGGDPFTLSARRLQKIIDALHEVAHVGVIRIHTRIPIANPSRVDDTLLSVLKSSSKAVHVVVHINHAKEITEVVRQKIYQLRQSNCSIFSQSVLLRGVNDSSKALEKLFRALLMIHVKPYYLHHLDRAKGTSHFRVSIKRGKEIMKDLQGRLSGLLLPKYMLDIPGGHGKIPIDDGYVLSLDSDTYKVEDYQGCTHLYFDRQYNEGESV